MSDERITNVREAHMIEILGNVSGLEEQVKAIHAEFVDSNKKMKEQYENSKNALFLSRTEAIESIQREAAKQVRDGVYGEIDGIKREVHKLIIELNRAADELRSRKRWDFIIYVFVSSFGVMLATFLIDKMMLNH